MLALEKQTRESFTKEIASILKKNYSSNIGVYSDFCDLPDHIMDEIIKFSNDNRNNDLNKRIGLSSFDEICKYINGSDDNFIILRLDIHGLNYLGKHFGQNAIYDVLKKVIDTAKKSMSKNDRCYCQEDGKLAIVLAEKSSTHLQANKIASVINSTMVFTHNHLFAVKAKAEIFYADKEDSVEEYNLAK